MSYVYGTPGYAQPGYYQPAYRAYPGYATGMAAPYGADAYGRGYYAGGQAAAPYAGQVAGAGNVLTDVGNSLFGLVNGIVGGVSDLLGGLVNGVTGAFGGGQPSYGYPQGAYPGAYAPMPQGAQAYMMNVPPPPPERNMGALYQAIAGDVARMPYANPQQVITRIATSARLAAQYRNESDEAARDAVREIRTAVREAESAARSGDGRKMSDAFARQQSAFNMLQRSQELMLAVWDETATAHLYANMFFGPYGRMRGADGNQSQYFLQSARMQWEGGRDRTRWFSATIQPPYQRWLAAFREVDAGMQRLQQLQGAMTLTRR